MICSLPATPKSEGLRWCRSALCTALFTGTSLVPQLSSEMAGTSLRRWKWWWKWECSLRARVEQSDFCTPGSMNHGFWRAWYPYKYIYNATICDRWWIWCPLLRTTQKPWIRVQTLRCHAASTSVRGSNDYQKNKGVSMQDISSIHSVFKCFQTIL